jgi:hypothetical protein
MSAQAIKQFVQEIRAIDRKAHELRITREEKSRALSRLRTKEAMASPVVQRAPVMSCR